MTDEMRDKEQDDEGGLMGGLKGMVETKGAAHVQGAVESAGEKLSQDQRTGVIEEILGALKGRGFDVNALTERVGLSSNDPGEMDSSDLGKIGGFVSEHATDLLPMLTAKIPGLEGLKGGGAEGVLGRITGLFGKKE
jgi:hypothetical protein